MSTNPGLKPALCYILICSHHTSSNYNSTQRWVGLFEMCCLLQYITPLAVIIFNPICLTLMLSVHQQTHEWRMVRHPLVTSCLPRRCILHQDSIAIPFYVSHISHSRCSPSFQLLMQGKHSLQGSY